MKQLLLAMTFLLVGCVPQQQQSKQADAGNSKSAEYYADSGTNNKGLSKEEIAKKYIHCQSYTEKSHGMDCMANLKAPFPKDYQFNFCNSFTEKSRKLICITAQDYRIQASHELEFCSSFLNEDLRQECQKVMRADNYPKEICDDCKLIQQEAERLACVSGITAHNNQIESEEKEVESERIDKDEIEIVEESFKETPKVLPLPVVDGHFSNWSEWSSCNKTCDSGVQKRHRSCVLPQNGGRPCVGESEQIRACNTQACKEQAIDGYLTAWGAWGICSKKCGGGVQKRSRSCEEPKHGGRPCEGALVEISSCNAHACIEERPSPINGHFTEWGVWSTCTKTCGTGLQTRSRKYIPAQNGGIDINGPLSEDRSCNQQSCEQVSDNTIVGNSKQCTDIDRRPLIGSFHTEGQGNLLLSSSDFEVIKSVQKRNCKYTVSADLGAFSIFLSSGFFRIDNIYGNSNAGSGAGEFKIASVNTIAMSFLNINFHSDYYPNPYATKNFSGWSKNGAVSYKILSFGSSQNTLSIYTNHVYKVNFDCSPRDCD